MTRYVVLCVCLVGAGCGGFGGRLAPGVFSEVPENPNYEEHVTLLMDFYCNQCHSEPNANTDDFVSARFASEGNVEGVFDARDRILERAVDATSNRMPPFPLREMSSIDKEVFLLWDSLDGPEVSAGP